MWHDNTTIPANIQSWFPGFSSSLEPSEWFNRQPSDDRGITTGQDCHEYRRMYNNDTGPTVAMTKFYWNDLPCAFPFDYFICEKQAECNLTTCLNGGTCLDNKTFHECLCMAGYNGSHCEIDLFSTTVPPTTQSLTTTEFPTTTDSPERTATTTTSTQEATTRQALRTTETTAAATTTAETTTATTAESTAATTYETTAATAAETTVATTDETTAASTAETTAATTAETTVGTTAAVTPRTPAAASTTVTTSAATTSSTKGDMTSSQTITTAAAATTTSVPPSSTHSSAPPFTREGSTPSGGTTRQHQSSSFNPAFTTESSETTPVAPPNVTDCRCRCGCRPNPKAGVLANFTELKAWRPANLPPKYDASFHLLMATIGFSWPIIFCVICCSTYFIMAFVSQNEKEERLRRKKQREANRKIKSASGHHG